LPANIQALFDKIETDFKTGKLLFYFCRYLQYYVQLENSCLFFFFRADLEKFRTQAPARFSNIQATKPLLVQVYALIQVQSTLFNIVFSMLS
jgi:hypothetical protein